MILNSLLDLELVFPVGLFLLKIAFFRSFWRFRGWCGFNRCTCCAFDPRRWFRDWYRSDRCRGGSRFRARLQLFLSIVIWMQTGAKHVSISFLIVLDWKRAFRRATINELRKVNFSTLCVRVRIAHSVSSSRTTGCNDSRLLSDVKLDRFELQIIRYICYQITFMSLRNPRNFVRLKITTNVFEKIELEKSLISTRLLS